MNIHLSHSAEYITAKVGSHVGEHEAAPERKESGVSRRLRSGNAGMFRRRVSGLEVRPAERAGRGSSGKSG